MNQMLQFLMQNLREALEATSFFKWRLHMLMKLTEQVEAAGQSYEIESERGWPNCSKLLNEF